jgi:hypothetical protein
MERTTQYASARLNGRFELPEDVGLTFRNVYGNGVTDPGMFLRRGQTDAAVVIENSTVQVVMLGSGEQASPNGALLPSVRSQSYSKPCVS